MNNLIIIRRGEERKIDMNGKEDQENKHKG
jgi:hypothetical protein